MRQKFTFGTIENIFKIDIFVRIHEYNIFALSQANLTVPSNSHPVPCLIMKTRAGIAYTKLSILKNCVKNRYF